MKKNQIFALVFTAVTLTSFDLTRASQEKQAPQPSATGTQDATTVRESVNRERLAALLSAVGVSVEDSAVLPARVPTSQEMQIRWDASVKGHAPAQEDLALTEREPAGRALTVVERRKRHRVLPRQRSLELSTNQVLVVAVNGQRQLRWWSLIPDPRITRAEFQDAQGGLSGQVLYRSKAEFVVALPDDQTITELQFYHPHWTGSGFTLELLGATPLQ